nr:TetR family transcriptional regulator [Actinomycetota bacterium]
AVAAAPSPREALLAFVTASIDFYVRYPRHMAALRAVFDAREPSPSREDRPEHRGELDDLGRILAAGQDRGELRAFDVPLMAATVRAVLDVCVRRILAGEDPARLRTEGAAIVDAATRAGRL